MEDARAFTHRLADLLDRERTALAEFLVALADFDRRRLWLPLGYGSLFDFLHRELGLSKASASFRKKAAELLQRFPELAGPIQDGRLCLTSVFELAKVLTPENRGAVLPRFFQLSRREAKAIVAELRPEEAPARREIVTAVRLGSPSPALALSASSPATVKVAAGSSPTGAARASALENERAELPAISLKVSLTGQTRACQLEADAPRKTNAPVPPPPPTSCEPLTADLSRLHVTVSRRFLEKLEKARAALSHSHPGASSDEILEAGLDLLISRHEKRRGIVEKPRKEAPPSSSEHVPAHVKRTVWKRDGGKCQWNTAGGGICGSTHRLQLDHVVPRARGGPSTVENLRILCAVHNDLAAREAYGDAFMDLFTGAGGRAKHAAAP